MVFGVAALIAFCSASLHPRARRRHHHRHPRGRRRRARPAFLAPGDRVRVEIDGLGVAGQPGPMTPEEALAAGADRDRAEPPARGARPGDVGAGARAGRRARSRGGPGGAGGRRVRGPLAGAARPDAGRPAARPRPGGAGGPGGVRGRAGVGGRRRPRHAAGPRARGPRRPGAGGGRRPVPRGPARGRGDASPSGGAEAAVAASTAAGAIAADLLDLDPEDFGPEIAEYVGAGRAAEDVDALARATGDPEIRTWARGRRSPRRRRTSTPRRAPRRGCGCSPPAPPPADPAEDLVWVPTILAPGAGGRRALPGRRGRRRSGPRARRRFGRSSASRKPHLSMLR